MAACLQQVPVPRPGTGGCPCDQFPNPCPGQSPPCLPWPTATQPGGPIRCNPPASKCNNCDQCEWVFVGGAPVCGGGSAGHSALPFLLGLGGLFGATLLAAKHPAVRGRRWHSKVRS